MTTFTAADSLHRLVKHAIDSGVSASLEEAEMMFRRYRLQIEFHPSAINDPSHHAALLTAVALGKRVFLGGVSVSGPLDTTLLVPMPLGRTLREAIEALGGNSGFGHRDSPTVVIGGGPGARRDGFCVRTAVAGWRGGVLPIHSELSPRVGAPMVLAGMLAASLAVNEAYLFANSGTPTAGRRAIGVSLWRPAADIDWLESDDSEPVLRYLPSRLWLIGLGHLGQAYLWALSLLPFRDSRQVSLVLQDVDFITPSTESTSILTEISMVGQKKTRAMASWADRRGFASSIQERLFAGDFKRQPDEPSVALCGLDNSAGRRALDDVGFDLIVEAGLGRGHRDFRMMRLHTLPGRRPATEIWKTTGTLEGVEDRPAYTKLIAESVLDKCGVTLLAGKAVGAPFVGATAAVLALSEVLRLLHGGPVHRLIDLDLLSIDQRLTSRHERDFSGLNPGFALASDPASY